MKKIFTICAALFLGTTAFSQTVGLIGPSVPGNTWAADKMMHGLSLGVMVVFLLELVMLLVVLQTLMYL
jgi:hypothetical protein